MLQKQHTLDKRNSAKIKVKEPQHVLEMNRTKRNQEFSIPGFPGWDFAKSRDPGIFRDGKIFIPGLFGGDFVGCEKKQSANFVMLQ